MEKWSKKYEFMMTKNWTTSWVKYWNLSGAFSFVQSMSEWKKEENRDEFIFRTKDLRKSTNKSFESNNWILENKHCLYCGNYRVTIKSRDISLEYSVINWSNKESLLGQLTRSVSLLLIFNNNTGSRMCGSIDCGRATNISSKQVRIFLVSNGWTKTNNSKIWAK